MVALDNKTDQHTMLVVCSMESLPIELIVKEIAHWLFEVDKQLLRRVNKKFHSLFPYEEIKFNQTEIELIHLIKYKKLWDDETLRFLASNGYLDCLKYAHENGWSWDQYTPENAAENGHLDCLKYAHENGCPWDEGVTNCAAKNGHLDCLKYAHENGCPWHQNTTYFAANSGNLDCLKYAHENGCPWDEGVTNCAASNGHLDCLR